MKSQNELHPEFLVDRDQENDDESSSDDTEPKPLLGYGDGPSVSSVASRKGSTSSLAGACIPPSRGPTKRMLFLFLFMTVGIVVFMLWGGDVSNIPAAFSPSKQPKNSSLFLPLYEFSDPDRPVPAIVADSRDFKSLSVMRERLQLAKSKYFAKLREDYGADHFNDIFVHDGDFIGKLALQSSSATGLSWDRMKRKLMMKVLHVQLLSDHDSRRVKFVWATGGHRYCAFYPCLALNEPAACTHSPVPSVPPLPMATCSMNHIRL